MAVPGAVPRLLSPASATVPALIVVLPLEVLAPERVRVPLPTLVSVLPEAPEMTPEILRAPASTPIELLPVVPRATVPVHVLAPAILRRAPALLTPSPLIVRPSAAKVVPVPASARVPPAETVVPVAVEPRAVAFGLSAWTTDSLT